MNKFTKIIFFIIGLIFALLSIGGFLSKDYLLASITLLIGLLLMKGFIEEKYYSLVANAKSNAMKNSDVEFKCKPVYYKGGHVLHFSKTGTLSPLGPSGELLVKKNLLMFTTNNKKFEIEIPIKKINFVNLKHHIGSRGTQQEAIAFAGAGMTLGSVGAMSKDLFVEIPYIDENGKKQKPVFEFTNKKNAEQFQKWLYDKMPSEFEN